ncbi:MAG: group 1 glycosyl transferase [Parcubacteria group bacterium Gr01-1014_33]|nr:MAG: group 1 glycosyl transferase [Parcubacteria group bacterium Gr01-1014_33]
MPTEKAHGIQLAKMCEAFTAAGIEVELVVPARKTVAESVAHFYDLRTPIRLTRLPVIDWYERNRFGFFVGSLSFMISYFFYLWYTRMRGDLKVMYTTDIDQFSFLLIPFLGVPYFVEIHDAKKKSILFSILFKYARGIIVINRIIKKKISEVFHISQEKIIVHPNGVDIEKFNTLVSREEAREKLSLPQKIPIALYVGRIYQWKGMDILLDTAAECKEIFFYIVGGTSDELVAVSGESRHLSNIVCAGSRKYEEIPLWLAAADVLLVLGTKENKYSYFHTSPMKLLEYMASHQPIVASDTPANREIVSESEVFFYESDNSESLAYAIKHVLHANHPELQFRIDHANKKIRTLTWEKRAEDIIHFIEKSLAYRK